MTADAARPYSSPLRANQAAATKARIINATVALLRHGDAAFSMQDVAGGAGVSVRTVYRAFPTKEDLLVGVLDEIKTRFEHAAGSPPTTRGELIASVPIAVKAVYELEPLYRALFATAAGQETHRAAAGERWAPVERAFADGLDGLSERQRRLVVSMLHLVTSSKSVLWLKDYAGLDVDEASDAVTWAVTALWAAAEEETDR